jgi:16S rRNA (cytidine1402-2'-O)-methyltransferase
VADAGSIRLAPDESESEVPEAPEGGPLEAGLYLVATPIGNLEDITLRALRVLKQADRIACEDTRLTQKLLNHFGIRTPTVSCHEHNERARTAELLELLQRGGRVAVVSDAGIPGISDPGMDLARAAIAAGIKVIPLPGANAALSALIASGLNAERFLFVGFLASQGGARRKQLSEIRALLPPEGSLTLVFYESPHRILAMLEDIENVWGPSVRIAVGRELTKCHEEFLRGMVAEIRANLASRERIRGEIVVVVEAQNNSRSEGDSQISVPARVKELMETEGLTEKEALKRVAKERDLSKSDVYRQLQQSKN